jgi:hypothetical protein
VLSELAICAARGRAARFAGSDDAPGEPKMVSLAQAPRAGTTPMDYYEELGLSRSATDADIKKACVPGAPGSRSHPPRSSIAADSSVGASRVVNSPR